MGLVHHSSYMSLPKIADSEGGNDWGSFALSFEGVKLLCTRRICTPRTKTSLRYLASKHLKEHEGDPQCLAEEWFVGSRVSQTWGKCCSCGSPHALTQGVWERPGLLAIIR